MKKKKNVTGPTVRFNTVLRGEPAEQLRDWKNRGIVKSYTDAVVQALRVFSQILTEQDLKNLQLKNLQDIEREN